MSQEVSGLLLATPDKVINISDAKEAVDVIEKDLSNIYSLEDWHIYDGITVVIPANVVTEVVRGLAERNIYSNYAIFPYTDGIASRLTYDDMQMAIKTYGWDVTVPGNIGVAVDIDD